MDASIASELAEEINRIVDLVIQREAINASISSLKKDIKENFDLPTPVITKIVSLVRKENIAEEDEVWQEIKNIVKLCK